MIIGSQFLVDSKDPEADRAPFRGIPGFRSIAVAEGGLICAVPPAEAGIHPLAREFSRRACRTPTDECRAVLDG